MASASPSMGHVLITGSSTGIGKACALHLAACGFEVLAGVRRENDARDLQQAAQGKGSLHGILLDVTNTDSIAAAKEQIKGIVGPRGLRALVNNAGIAVAGPIEFVTLADWRRQFEVNLFGQIAVTQAMLPLLRQYVSAGNSSQPRIVMIGSIAGKVGQPILTPYTASKHAVEALSDGLRIELRGQGIGISLLEPGAVQSEIWRKGGEEATSIPADSAARQLYGRIIDAIVKAAADSAAHAIPGERAARVVERCLTAHRAPTRVLVGRDAKLIGFLRRLLPDRWFDAVLCKALKI